MDIDGIIIAGKCKEIFGGQNAEQYYEKRKFI